MTHTAVRSDDITLMVNGDSRQVARDTTLAELLRTLELDPRMVVVEHNRVILRDRSGYASVTLVAGDTVEIVHFVGGG